MDLDTTPLSSAGSLRSSSLLHGHAVGSSMRENPSTQPSYADKAALNKQEFVLDAPSEQFFTQPDKSTLRFPILPVPSHCGSRSDLTQLELGPSFINKQLRDTTIFPTESGIRRESAPNRRACMWPPNQGAQAATSPGSPY